MRSRQAPLPSPLAILTVCAILANSCSSIERISPEDALNQKGPKKVEKGTTLMDPAQVDAMLSMTFLDALQLSGDSAIIPPYFKVAAQRIDHPEPIDGNITSLTAHGKVFMEIDFLEPLVALAESAEVSVGGVTLSGRPVLRRGYSIIEATSEETVMEVKGDSLSVDGPHRTRSFGERPLEDDLPPEIQDMFRMTPPEPEGRAPLSENPAGIDPAVLLDI